MKMLKQFKLLTGVCAVCQQHICDEGLLHTESEAGLVLLAFCLRAMIPPFQQIQICLFLYTCVGWVKKSISFKFRNNLDSQNISIFSHDFNLSSLVCDEDEVWYVLCYSWLSARWRSELTLASENKLSGSKKKHTKTSLTFPANSLWDLKTTKATFVSKIYTRIW